MGISTSRLFDRRAYRGRIDGEYRMRSPSVASRSRTRGWRTATGPIPVKIARSGRWPWGTTRCWPVAFFRSACFARNSATSASMAWVSSARAPLRRISVRESVKAPGWPSLITLLSDTAYHSFIGEVEALNTTMIRRLAPLCRHQLLAIAQPGGFLFPKLPRGSSGKPSVYATRKLGEWARKHLGITDERIEPNHSFRHYVKSQLLKAKVDVKIRDMICGHGKSVARQYEHGDIEQMAEAISLLPNPLG